MRSDLPMGLFSQVSSGDPVKISAKLWNEVLKTLRSERYKEADGNPSFNPGRNVTIVNVRNDSGSDCKGFDVLGINGPLITPTNSLQGFLHDMLFSGVTPVAGTHEGKFLLLIEPIPKGGIGRAVVTGVIPARLSFAGSGDPVQGFAEIANGSFILANGTSGSAQVLYAEPSGTTRWGLVRLGGGGAGGGGGGNCASGATAQFLLPAVNTSTGTTFNFLSTVINPIDTYGPNPPVTSSTAQDSSTIDCLKIVKAGRYLLNFNIAGIMSLWGAGGSAGTPTTGQPFVSFAINTNSNTAGPGTRMFNGAQVTALPDIISSSYIFDLNAGDTIGLYFFNDTNVNFANTDGSTVSQIGGYLEVSELSICAGGGSGSSQITAVVETDNTNATATMANITLDNNPVLTAGTEYAGRMDVWCNNSVAAEGIQFDFGGGSATFTDFKASLSLVQSASATYTQGTTRVTAYNSAMNYSVLTGEVTMVVIFSFKVNAGGTLIPRFAENSHTIGTATVESRTNIRIDPLA